MRQEKKGRVEGEGGEKIEGRLISSLFLTLECNYISRKIW